MVTCENCIQRYNIHKRAMSLYGKIVSNDAICVSNRCGHMGKFYPTLQYT